MPNICNFKMKVVGERENINTFVSYLNAEYDYHTDDVCEEDHHFFRVFDVYEDIDENNSSVIEGDCAWSVSSCMTQDGYYAQIKESYPEKFKGTSLYETSKFLNLDIEVYSWEPGVGFAEHMIYQKGKEILNECVDYTEAWLDGYDTKEEAEEDLNIEITDEQFEDGYIHNCEYDLGNIDWEI